MSAKLPEFAVHIINLDLKLCKTYSGKYIYGQLFSADSSSGANRKEK